MAEWHCAVNVACGITGAPRVHLVGYCIGGTLVSTYMAWLNRRHAREEDVPVAHFSLFTTLTDFQSPGDNAGTWWEDWIAWLSPQCGPLIGPPPTSTPEHPKLAAAPGAYVLEQ